MIMFRRVASVLAAALVLPLAAHADTYPSQPIRAIVSNAPGTGTDNTARLIASQMSKDLGVPLVVDNKAGAGGAIATDYAAKTAPDGYSILFTTGAHYSFPATIENPGFDAQADFVPVASFAQAPIVMFVPADSPYRTVQDVIDAATQNPQAISYSSPGTGTSSHLAAVMFLAQTDIDMLHVPYKSASQSALDVASGQTQVGFNGTSVTMPLLESGRIRILAVSGSQRSASLPDVPTLAESGLEGYEFVTPILAFVRTGTPQSVVDQLGTAMQKAAAQPEFLELCQNLGLDPVFQGPEQMKERASGEFEKAAHLAELAGVSVR